jgi:hypothetical protein
VDADFSVVSRLSEGLQVDYQTDEADRWEGTPFHWFSKESSPRKGAIGKKLVRRWAEQEGMQVIAKSSRGHDFRVDGVRVVVKLSLVWNGGLLVFEQIKDQPYDVASLLALEPENARLWIVPKEVLWEHAEWQHMGASGQDTKWLRFDSASPRAWLRPYGGTLSRARRALEQARSGLSG